MIPLKKWQILNTDPDKSVIDVILQNRNLPDSHLDGFRLSEKLHDPFLMGDMEKAVNKILEAVKSGRKIGIYGDYDVDGIVSTTLMIKLFEKLGTRVKYYIPDRYEDGYGLRPAGIDQALSDGIELLITVDNGISSNEAIDYANEKGMEVIVTDHHLQEGELPQAYAVVNPNRKECNYLFKGLCGAGVVYKIIQAIGSREWQENEFKLFMLQNLDLVTMAIIADMVPLVDENYALVRFGLKSLTETRRPGIVELKRAAGMLGNRITTTGVGFYLSPRLNAAGRLASARLAVDLLLSKNQESAREYAQKLNLLNSKRQKKQAQYLDEIAELYPEIDKNKIIIVANENWESGVVGLLSGQLKEQFGKPALVFTKDPDGNFVGSCRSIDGFHITNALTRFNSLFLNYGGHQKAAGVTIPEENFTEFKTVFTQYANAEISEEDLIPDLIIDTVVRPEQMNESTVKTIESIGPFGEGNPEPVVAMQSMVLKDIRSLSSGKHIKLFLLKGGRIFEAVWWRRGEMKDILKLEQNLDVAFKPEINEWNNRKNLQLVVQDVRPN